MKFDDIVEKRRSIRKYQDKEVSDELIEELINSARLCQSAKNRQPWLFKVLKNTEKDHIADMMINWSKSSDEKEGYKRSVEHTANVMKEAPVLILVFYERDPFWDMSDVLSIGAAIEHVCLKAMDLDLGSLWICNTNCIKEDISNYIKRPELTMISAIAIGYTDESPDKRPRKNLEEIMI